MDDNTGINNETNTNGAQNGAQGAQNAGANNGNGNNGAQNGANNGNGDNGQKLSPFDEFLKGDGMQAEFDRRVAKALETQKTKLTATTQEQINTAVQEALKVSKMTKEEQAQHEAQKKADELAKREAAILERELKASAKEKLIADNYPVSLAEIINYTDEDSVNASIEVIEKAFQSSVQTSVDEKLKGGKPMQKAGDNNATLEQQIENAMKRGFFG